MSKSIIYIRSDIGREEGEISAALFGHWLRDIKGATEVELKINSMGGSLFEATSIVAQMLDFPAPFTATVEGIAASSAGLIALSSERMQAYSTSFFMAHSVSAGFYGNARDAAKQSALLSQLDDMVAGLIARRTGGSAAQWRAALDADEVWIDGTELSRLGLATLLDEERPALASAAQARAQSKVRNRLATTTAFMNKLIAQRPAPPKRYPTDERSRQARIAQMRYEVANDL